MRAVYENAKYFKDILKAIETLASEITVKATQEGLSVKIMDPSRVALACLELPKSSFWEFDNQAETTFTFDVERLIKLLKNIYKDDRIILEPITDPIVTRLNIALESDLKRQFKIPLMENPEDAEIPTPKITFTCTAKVTVEGLKKIVEDAKLVSDTIRIIGDSEKICFEAKGDMEDSVIDLKKGDEHLLDLETHEVAKATYSLKYLEGFVKALHPLVALVELSYSTDMPMKFEANLENGGTLTYYLAGRIEVDEEEPLKQEQQKEEPIPIEPQEPEIPIEPPIPEEAMPKEEPEPQPKTDEPEPKSEATGILPLADVQIPGIKDDKVLCLHCDKPAVGICVKCEASVCEEHAKSLHSHGEAKKQIYPYIA